MAQEKRKETPKEREERLSRRWANMTEEEKKRARQEALGLTLLLSEEIHKNGPDSFE